MRGLLAAAKRNWAFLALVLALSAPAAAQQATVVINLLSTANTWSLLQTYTVGVKAAVTYTSAATSSNATTPSVANVSIIPVSGTGPYTITNFTNGADGQMLIVFCIDGNATVDRSNAYLAGGLNFICTANDTLTLVKIGSSWVEMSRSINS
jgi:hypothetical protein